MSQVAGKIETVFDVVDQKTLLNRTDENAQLQAVLDRYVTNFCAPNGHGVPRYGLLSILLRKTPTFLYDHPGLVQMCDTAFTDGHHIFFSKDFFYGLAKADIDSKREGEPTQSVIPVLMHELMHISLRHHARGHAFPPELWNAAADMFINPAIVDAYRDLMTFGALFREDEASTIYGLKPSLRARFFGKGEERIAQDLHGEYLAQMAAYKEAFKAGFTGQPAPGGGNQNGGNAAASGDKQQTPVPAGAPGMLPGGGEPDKQQQPTQSASSTQSGNAVFDPAQGAAQGYADGQAARSMKDLEKALRDAMAGKGDRHMMTPRDLVEFLEEHGLDGVKEALDLPDSNDEQAFEQMNKKADMNLQDALGQAAEIRNHHHNGSKMPGAHIEQCAGESIEMLFDPVMKWKTGLRDMIVGVGRHTAPTDDVPSPMYYIDPAQMGLNSPYYEGIDIPARNNNCVLFIVDTSGSVNSDLLRRLFSEAIGIVREEEDPASLILMSADTMVRGEPTEINEDNVDEVVDELKAYGRGGTDFVAPLNVGMNWVREHGRKVSGVVYATDLGAPPPTKGQLPDNCPPLAFICEGRDYDRRFAKAVEAFGEVYKIEEDMEVDFEALAEEKGYKPDGMVL